MCLLVVKVVDTGKVVSQMTLKMMLIVLMVKLNKKKRVMQLLK